MKHLGKLSFGLLAMLMTACSSDEPITPGGDQVGGENDVYASLTLRLPSSNGTRAVDGDGIYTNDGDEVGQDFENKVSNVLIVLAYEEDGTYKFLTKATSDTQEAFGTDLKYTLTFSSSKMTPDALADGSNIPSKKNVYVFAYCNPSRKLTVASNGWNVGESKFINEIANIIGEDGIDGTMWTNNKFLMTNCELSAPVDIPSRDELVKTYNKAENAFPLGTVKVKRAAARFDFMTTTTDAGLNKYNITENGTNKVLGTVELTQMALFNLNKYFYYLPRTYANWNWSAATSFNLCGDLESYVVSPYASWKASESLNTNSNRNNIEDNYFYNLLNGISDLDWVTLSDWNEKHGIDNDSPWTHPDGLQNHDYRIWRYATENTIPQSATADSQASQRAGITTGVVFKAVFTPSEEQEAIWNGHTVYAYNGVIYGDYETLKAHCEKYSDTAVAAAFKKVGKFNTASAGNDPTENLLSGVSKTDRNGFVAYAPTDGKYIMYYYYYNRHNTNGINTSMGANEFGVVRNNVYKLRVTTINSFGRPDTPDPDEPDEEESAYFTVSCIVMPWTVRVNNIEF